MSAVNINDLASEITNALKEYTTEIEEGLEEAQMKAAQDGAKKLRSSSPKNTGKYAKGWRAKKEDRGWVIYNSTRGQITHLLEKGHAKRGGGRVPGRVHILPVEEQAIDQYEREVEKVIRG